MTVKDDVFFRTFLAALVVKGVKHIRMKPSHLHYAFRVALRKINIPEFFCGIDLEWDPLYIRSAWLDRQLAQASYDLILEIRRGAPVHYKIHYGFSESQRLLLESKLRLKFLGLADEFLEIVASIV